MLGMNTLRAKESVETTPDQWPAEIGSRWPQCIGSIRLQIRPLTRGWSSCSSSLRSCALEDLHTDRDAWREPTRPGALPYLEYGTSQPLPQLIGVCLSTSCCFAV
jgi:hypothetical protein